MCKLDVGIGNMMVQILDSQAKPSISLTSTADGSITRKFIAMMKRRGDRGSPLEGLK
jgi:hypothetical protein